MNCIICDNNELKMIKKSLRDHKSINVVKCDKCRNQQLDALPALDELQEFYDKDMQTKSIYTDIDVKEIRKNAIFDVKRRIELVEKIIKNKRKNRVLEIGTGYGFFMKEMETRDYSIEGIEISKSRRDIANNICNGKIYPCDLLKEVPLEMVSRYDVVVMFQVLEHILDPKLFLSNVKKVLKSEGTLIIEVPNSDDHLLNISKEYFDFFYQLAHISYYSPKSLEGLLYKCNFKNTNIYGAQRYSIENMVNWLINKKPQIENPSYQPSKGLEWLDDYYKHKVMTELKSDTIIAIANK